MTEEQKKEYLDYLKKEHNLNDAQAEEYFQYASSQDSPQISNSAPEESHYIRNAVDTLGRGLDFAGGIARTGAAQIAEGLTGRDIVKEGDWAKAAYGKAPGTSEYLSNAGVPEGASLGDVYPSITGKWYDPSVRGVAGFVGDVALDPLTYVSGGLSALSKSGTTESKLLKALQLANSEGGITKAGSVAQKVLNPIEAFNKYRADKNYASAFNKLDKVSMKEGNAYKVSDILKKEGFTGDAAKAAQRLSEINRAAGEASGAVLEEADKLGAKVDLMQSFDGALQYAEKLKKMASPEAKQLAQDIESRVMGVWDTYGSHAPIGVIQEEKQFLGDIIGKSGYAATSDAALTKKSQKAIDTSFAKGNENAVKNVSDDLYKKLKEAKSIYSSTNDEIQKAATTIGNQVSEHDQMLKFTIPDFMLLAGGTLAGGGNPLAGAGALATKKFGQAVLSTEGKSLRGAAGKYISELPDYALKDSAARQVWEKLMEKNTNEKK